jgi:hypothetical protein
VSKKMRSGSVEKRLWSPWISSRRASRGGNREASWFEFRVQGEKETWIGDEGTSAGCVKDAG